MEIIRSMVGGRCRKTRHGVLALVFWSLSAVSASADHTFLNLPIECEIGKDCYIQSYVDADPSKGAQDYTCGSLAYDTHRGTDFRIRGLKAMKAGVSIVAAGPGVVTAVRDGMRDINVRKINDPNLLRHIKEKAALGNAVVIQHDHGVVAYYGHLRNGSVLVRKGQRVVRGEPLGLVGLSGDTEFPHIHFEIRRQGKVVDPFTGLDAPAGCGTKPDTPLWHPEAFARIPYVRTGLHAAGFSTVKPDAQSIDEGRHDATTLGRAAPALLFWAMIYGPRLGDDEFLQFIAPDGTVLAEHRNIVKRDQAQSWRAVGKRLRGQTWPVGEYIGRYVLSRDKSGTREIIVEVERTLTVE